MMGAGHVAAPREGARSCYSAPARWAWCTYGGSAADTQLPGCTLHGAAHCAMLFARCRVPQRPYSAAGSLNLDLYLPCLQVPNIFIGGRGVGGCNEGPGLLPLYRAGQLAPMLRDVGAL